MAVDHQPAAQPSCADETARALDTPLYNSRITNTYLKLLQKRYPQVDVGELLRFAGMKMHQVEDEGHWFTQRQVNRFQQKLRELTGNPGIAREAGRFSAAPEALSGLGRSILGLLSIARAYSLAGRFTGKFTRSSRIESRVLGPRSAEILVTLNEGVREESFQCESRLGYLESVARYFDSRLTRIEHPECLFRGDAHCRYLLTWQPSRAARWRRVRIPAGLVALAALVAAAAGHLAWAHLAVLLPAIVTAVLLVSVLALHLDNGELRAAVTQLEHTADELVDQIDLNSRNALMISEIGQSLGKGRSIEEILRGVIEALERRLDYDRGVVLLADQQGSRLAVAASFGYSPEQLAVLNGDDGLSLERSDPRGAIIRCLRERQAFLVNDLAAAGSELAGVGSETAWRLGVKSFICCPIAFEDQALGVLAVDNCSTKRPLLERDMNLLMGIAPQIAISIRHVRLVEDNLGQARRLTQELERRVPGAAS